MSINLKVTVMISYETYKALHLFFILCLFMSIGFIAYDSKVIQMKKGKWLVGLASFLILVAGMGLIARLGFKHGEPFPLWIKLKIGNWVALNILFIALFKVKSKEYRAGLTFLIMLLAWFGIWLAVNKPL